MVAALEAAFSLGARSYKKLAEDVHKGSQILCADGSIVLEVVETDPSAGIVTCMCQNNAKLGCAAAAGPGPAPSGRQDDLTAREQRLGCCRWIKMCIHGLR